MDFHFSKRSTQQSIEKHVLEDHPLESCREKLLHCRDIWMEQAHEWDSGKGWPARERTIGPVLYEEIKVFSHWPTNRACFVLSWPVTFSWIAHQRSSAEMALCTAVCSSLWCPGAAEGAEISALVHGNTMDAALLGYIKKLSCAVL